MRIGIVPCLDERAGGVYQYSLTMLDALLALQKEEKDDFVIFTDELNHKSLSKFKKAGWKILPLYKSNLLRLFIRQLIKNTIFEDWASGFLNFFRPQQLIAVQKYETAVDQEQRNWFLSQKVELMIYPTSNILSFKTMIPYIFTVHDLNHRIYKEFSEVSEPEEWKGREYVFRNGIKNAAIILVDSRVGKEDVLRFYKDEKISADKIKILPFLSAKYLKDADGKNDEKAAGLFKLPEEYLFYPAQFWPHKNHLRIIKALGVLKSEFNLNIPLVLCGSHSGALREKTFKEVMKAAKKLGVNISYLGYVEDKYMPVIYKNAKALVMPTFFGPTNIPILEAWSLNCSVITSNLRGVRDQAGDGALLVDPRSVDSIALAIKKIWTDDKLRNKLVKLGKVRLALYTQEDYNLRLKTIIDDAKSKISNKV